jgi:hypothetical protein
MRSNHSSRNSLSSSIESSLQVSFRSAVTASIAPSRPRGLSDPLRRRRGPGRVEARFGPLKIIVERMQLGWWRDRVEPTPRSGLAVAIEVE